MPRVSRPLRLDDRSVLTLAFITPATVFIGLMLVATVGLLIALSLQLGNAAVPGFPLSLGSWSYVLSSNFFWVVVQRTLKIAALTALFSILIAYPTAWALSKVRTAVLIPAMIVLFSPILFSVVVRAYGWVLLLLPNSPLGSVFSGPLLYTDGAVVLTLVHAVLPFAVLPILVSVRGIPPQCYEAASDLGASGVRQVVTIFLPLTAPGAIAAAQLTFTLSLSSYVIPTLMGGGRTPVLATDIFTNLELTRWPVAAVEAIFLVGLAMTGVGLLSFVGRMVDWRPSGTAGKAKT